MNGLLFIALFALALIVAVLLRKRPGAGRVSLDAQVIEQLRQAGSDLARPHEIEFFLYFQTRDAAVAAEKELTGRGFSANIERAAKGPEWLLLFTRSMTPSESDLTSLRAELTALASRHGGQYDGWGSPVVPGKPTQG